MKKLLSLAVLAGLATSASAVNLSTDGTGEVLLYPYYKATDGFGTNVSIVNTTNEYKAIRVRFLEGRNSWEVLDFNLYLSPYDMWSGAISNTGASTAVLTTSDESCTVPQIGDALAASSEYITAYGHNDPGAAVSDDSRTFEGHIEVIEMGRVFDLWSRSAAENAFAENMVDLIDGDKGGCDEIASEWGNENGQWDDRSGTYTENNYGLVAPTGGLFGAASVVNAAEGTAFAYEATAVQNFYQIPVQNTTGNNLPGVTGLVQEVNSDHTTVTDDTNALDNGTQVADNTADLYVRLNGAQQPTLLQNVQFASPADAFSALFMTEALSNEYVINDTIGAATDWVITFPTKHYYVNASSMVDNYKYVNGQYGALALDRYEVDGQNGVNLAPFFGTENDYADYSVAIENVTVFDAEGNAVKTADKSVTIHDQPKINFETNVLEFSNDRDVLSSSLTTGNNEWRNDFNADDFPAGGWARVDFTESAGLSGTAANGQAVQLTGYPMLGFAATNFVNGTLPNNTLANYSYAKNHASTKMAVMAQD